MEKELRTHRVGSITVGIAMIVFGIMFILHLFIHLISYEMIFRLWPLILIGLGVEILLSNMKERRFVYDKGAVFLLVIVAILAVCMAGADVMFTYCKDMLSI